MFDFHMHSGVSFDSTENAENMVKAAENRGLKEICFTDHRDYYRNENGIVIPNCFSLEDYNRAYDNLRSDKVRIRRGLEFGMTPWNKDILKKDLSERDYDFVIGSVHFVDDIDVFEDEKFWNGKSTQKAYEEYLKEIIKCLKVHDDFDVLGHISYVSKCGKNPDKIPLKYEDFQDLSNEILSLAAKSGKGIEINTSGIRITGDYLPPVAFLKRFKELGGEIVTIGSDSHNAERVGQYCFEAAEIVKDIFGYVCTFSKRKPIFHK